MSTARIKDASAVIADANVSQELLPADPGRQYLLIQNPVGATTTLFVDFDQAAVPGEAVELDAGCVMRFENCVIAVSQVTVRSATDAAQVICKYA